MGNIASVADGCSNAQQLSKQTTATACVHQQIRLRAVPVRHERERFVRESRNLFSLRILTSFKFYVALHKARTGGNRRVMHKLVELATRHIIGIRRQHAAHRHERKLQRILLVKKPCYTRLVSAHFCDFFLDAKLAKNRDQARHQRLTHNHFRPLSVVEKYRVHSLTREQAGQRRARRAGSDDAYAKFFVVRFHLE